MLWDHCRIWGPSLTETSLCGTWLYLFLIFERKFLLLVMHFDQMMEGLSRQRVLPYVSAYWLASLTGTELKFNGAVRQAVDGVNRIGTWSASWHSRRFIGTSCADCPSSGWLSVCSLPFHSHCLIAPHEKRLESRGLMRSVYDLNDREIWVRLPAEL